MPDNLLSTNRPLNSAVSSEMLRNVAGALGALDPMSLNAMGRSSGALAQSLSLAEGKLRAFAADSHLMDKMSLAFGNRWDVKVATDLVQSWSRYDFRNLPKIEVRLGSEINGANGAYAAETNTIYIAKDFLTRNANNPKAVVAVLLEEIGHAIDVRINKTDAAGDEGDIFSRLVRGEKIGASDLLSLKTENDHAWLKIDGHSTEIEMSQVAMATLNGRFYQSVQGTDNKIYTRWSTNGTNWSTWDNKGGGETLNAPSLAVLNNRLYQSHRGLDNKIYTRSSTDGQNWSNWATNGAGDTPNAPALTTHNGRLYQSIRGLDNNIYTRSSTDGQTWNAWNSNGVGQTLTAPALVSFNGKLFQARQGTDNKIYTRSSADGVAWSSWSASDFQSTPSAITMTSLNGRLFQSIRGTDNKMYIRSSSDGFSWSQWTSDKVGETPDAPSLNTFNGRLYQSHQGFDSNIYTRSSVDGVRWTTWSQSGGLTPTETPGLNVWRATYFNTNNLTGPAVINRLESAINYDWGTGSPDPRINRDNFSVRWEGSFYFKQGVYAFKPNMDDGVRIWVDGQMVHDAWNSPSTTSFNRAMTAGAHQIKIEYRELGVNARAIFSTEEQLGVWNATYYNNTNLSGTPVVNRVDSAINFDWGTGSPDARINRDNFSARWEGKFAFDGGSYTFKPNTDDGVRILIDGQPVSDSWNSPTNTNFNREISAGIHQITVEYRELAGNARANFSWEKTPIGYYRELLSLTNSDWDVESGDDTRFDGNLNNGESRDAIKQIYTDLTTAIFGTRKP